MKPRASASCRPRSVSYWQSPISTSWRAARWSSTTSICRNNGSGAAAFSLLELSVVVLLIGLLAVAAVPALKRNQLNARSSAVLNDLRVFASAFQAYAQEHGDWPAGGTAPGAFPVGMDGYLSKTNWQRVSPIGGLYQWAVQSPQVGGRYAAVIIIASQRGNRVTSDANQLNDIDAKLDDGNLTSGNFFLGYRNQPVFVLEH